MEKTTYICTCMCALYIGRCFVYKANMHEHQSEIESF